MQSGLVHDILTKSAIGTQSGNRAYSSGWVYSLLMFFGFCLIGSLAPSAFINKVSDRLNRGLELAQKKAAAAEQQARKALGKSDALQASLEEEDDDTEQYNTSQVQDLDHIQKSIIVLLSLQRQIRRSISGILDDLHQSGIEIQRPAVTHQLQKLLEMGLVQTFQAESDLGCRYTLSARGNKAAKHIRQQHSNRRNHPA